MFWGVTAGQWTCMSFSGTILSRMQVNRTEQPEAWDRESLKIGNLPKYIWHHFLCLFYVWEQDLMRKHCRNKNLSSVFHGCHEDQLTSDACMHIRAPAVPDNNDDKIINSLNLFWINAFVSNSYFHYRRRKIIECTIKSTQKQKRH